MLIRESWISQIFDERSCPRNTLHLKQFNWENYCARITNSKNAYRHDDVIKFIIDFPNPGEPSLSRSKTSVSSTVLARKWFWRRWTIHSYLVTKSSSVPVIMPPTYFFLNCYGMLNRYRNPAAVITGYFQTTRWWAARICNKYPWNSLNSNQSSKYVRAFR